MVEVTVSIGKHYLDKFWKRKTRLITLEKHFKTWHEFFCLFFFVCLYFSSDEVKFRQDLMNIAGTTLSSKLLTHHKDHFTKLAVEAVLRLKGSGNLEAIHVIKKLGGSLADSYLDEGMYIFCMGKDVLKAKYWVNPHLFSQD